MYIERILSNLWLKEIGLWKQFFSKESFPKISISIKDATMRMKTEKIGSRFSDTFNHKINFTAYGLHRDHSQAWELKICLFWVGYTVSRILLKTIYDTILITISKQSNDVGITCDYRKQEKLVGWWAWGPWHCVESLRPALHHEPSELILTDHNAPEKILTPEFLKSYRKVLETCDEENFFPQRN